MKKDNIEGLTQLGSKKTEYNYNSPNPKLLEIFPNQFAGRQYTVQFKFDEFTSLCPKTGQPDFAEITINYMPGNWCIETKSLKLYFLGYRQHGAFMETIVNTILDDCVNISDPIYMEVTGKFNIRGGTLINVHAEYDQSFRK